MSSHGGDRAPWARLIFNPGVIKDPVEIRDERFVIGRGPSCTLSFDNNKNIAPHHCTIERLNDGRIFLLDFSADGVFVNGTERIGSGMRKEIFDGSVISLYKEKGNSAAGVDCTLKLILDSERMAVNLPDIAGPVRRRNYVSIVPSSVSLPSHTSVRVEPPPKKLRKCESAVGDQVLTASLPAPASSLASSAAMNTSASNDKSTSVLNLVSTKDINEAGPSSSGAESSTRPKDGSVADNLICSICFDIIHDCISVLPCMHCFCAGCFSEWMDRSKLCPECRVKVQKVRKNHVVNNIVNAYVAEHPEKQRPEEDIRDLDAKNKITDEMVNLKLKKKDRKVASTRSHGSDCECSECDDYLSDEDSDDDSDSSPSGITNAPAVAPHYTPQCRFCVGFRGFPVANARPVPYSRPCPYGQPHIMCQCCYANMPDRRLENNPQFPPITCAVCQRAFCNLFFGCARAGCTGCLARFKDVKFSSVTYKDLVNNNQFETNILQNYMTSKNKTWADVVKECTTKLDRNEFYCSDKPAYNLSSESPLCQTCAVKNFRELVYQYRQVIPKEDLPAEAKRRDDCYWGKNCRTQKTKPAHAANFNHICEQTKF